MKNKKPLTTLNVTSYLHQELVQIDICRLLYYNITKHIIIFNISSQIYYCTIKKKKNTEIIEVGVTGDTSLSTTEWRKTQKYQGLKNAVRFQWQLRKIQVIPLIIRKTGLMKKITIKLLE